VREEEDIRVAGKEREGGNRGSRRETMLSILGAFERIFAVFSNDDDATFVDKLKKVSIQQRQDYILRGSENQDSVHIAAVQSEHSDPFARPIRARFRLSSIVDVRVISIFSRRCLAV
jgi:hypothetical protein